jgi:hypothetical protein
MDLVRKLLAYFEDKVDDQHVLASTIASEGSFEGYAADPPLTIDYHLILLYEAGFIAGEPSRTNTGRVISVLPFRLTWEGHEFLAAARDESVWKKVKAKLTAGAGDVPIALLKELLMQTLRSQLGT